MGAKKEWLVQGEVTVGVHCVVTAQTAQAAQRAAYASARPDPTDPKPPRTAWWFDNDNSESLRDTIQVTDVREYVQP